MKRSLAAIVGSALVLASTTSAVAMPRWLAPTTLSPAGASGAVDVAVGTDGTAVVVWDRLIGGDQVVRAARYEAGVGAWTPAQSISIPGEAAFSKQVAAGGRGDAVAVWSRSDGVNDRIQATRYEPGTGAWTSPVNLSADGLPVGFGAAVPDVGVDARGNATVVWALDDSTGFRIQTTRYDVAAGTWSAPDYLSQPGGVASSARVAVNPLGDAVAVWRRFDGANSIAQAARYDAGTASWSAPATLSAPGASAVGPAVAVDLAGNALAVWSRSDGVNDRIQLSWLDAGTGVWSPPDELSAAGGDATNARVALSPAGAGVVSWSRSDGTHDIFQARRVDATTGALDPTTDLSPGGQDAYGRIAVNPLGQATAVYYSPIGSVRVRARMLDPATGAWAPPVDVSEPGEEAVGGPVGIDALGNVFAAWHRDSGPQRTIRAAGFDAAAPRLANLSVPPTAGLGQPVTMSFSATDLFGLGATSWSFGDGSTFDPGVPIGLVQHSYQAPGTYTVTVTQRDAVGNESSASAPVTVSGGVTPSTSTPTATPTARCAGRAATIVGTSGRDVIRGTRGPDVIHSLGGNDVVRGLGGNDRICLGSGNDRGIGGGGADRIFGQAGRDRVDGSAGNDRLFGGSGNDRLRGQNGNDRHFGGPGRDIALGGRGNDRLDGGPANDRLLGGSGRDVLLGRSGRDLLAGGSGRDLALGGGGNDRLFGNGARDLLDGGRGRDLANGGGGTDRCIRSEIRVSC